MERPRERECKECGNKYLPNANAQQYCSKSCRKEKTKEDNRQYLKLFRQRHPGYSTEYMKEYQRRKGKG